MNKIHKADFRAKLEENIYGEMMRRRQHSLAGKLAEGSFINSDCRFKKQERPSKDKYLHLLSVVYF